MLELYRERLPATPATVPRARHGVRDALTEAGIRDSAFHANVALAVSEATTNAVRHAYPPNSGGHVEVVVALASNSLIITVSDQGRGMGGATRATRGMGLGLALIHTQTEHVKIQSGTTGTTLTLHFRSANGRPAS
jgi:anti-sigma regulatory factor (Ser/Thr protein kinase)